MSKDKLLKDVSIKEPIWKRIIYSAPVLFIVKIPPIPWIAQKLTSITIRLIRIKAEHRVESSISLTDIEQIPANKEQNSLDAELKLIAQDIVHSLGFAGAMVAAYEQGDALPSRAFYIDPSIAKEKEIQEWENQVRRISPSDQPISLTDPAIARVYINKSKYKNNLSVRAAKSRVLVTSHDLFDLFTPIAPEISRPFVKGVQEGLGIKQVIAVPFFIDVNTDGKYEQEFVGNLFAAKIGEEFSNEDKKILTGFAHHAATAIQGERRRVLSESNQKLVLDMQRYIENEEQILHRIVRGIVEDLKYTGAMVATYETGDALPVRAFYVNPLIAEEKDIQGWEDQVRKISPSDQLISLTDPTIARVYVYQDKYKDNLSAKAAKEKKPVTSNDLFDLFTPIAPEISQPFVKGIQDGLEIKQVIAVPFFLDDELVGNLFAATQSEKFNTWEIEVLQAFGQNAAAGIRNARIYKRSEDRREAAQIFGRMAFSAATNVHAFKNHIGLIRGNISILNNIDAIANDNEKRREILNQIMPPINRRIEDIIIILEKLHTPWQIQPDSDVYISASIEHALTKLFANWKDEKWIRFESQDLPTIKTSQEMLVETFRILIKNAHEAIIEKEISLRENGKGSLVIDSRLLNDLNVIEVTISDSGVGIKPENFEKVFEMRWSTKSTGLGFGLFWVKDYLEGLGGKILFDSRINEGTTFTVHLPLLVTPPNISDV